MNRPLINLIIILVIFVILGYSIITLRNEVRDVESDIVVLQMTPSHSCVGNNILSSFDKTILIRVKVLENKIKDTIILKLH